MASKTNCHTKIEYMSKCKFCWFVLCRRGLQYLVIGCTATLWCALKPACQNPVVRASTHSKCGENIFISIRSSLHNQRQGQSLGGGAFPCGMLTLAADGCHQPFSVITAQIWSRVTVIFLIVVARSPLRGFNSSAAQSSLQCQATITHTLWGSRWISWPPGVGVTTPAVQSANTAVLEQLKAASVAVRRSLPRIRRDSGVSSTLTVSQHGRAGLRSVTMMDKQPGPEIQSWCLCSVWRLF